VERATGRFEDDVVLEDLIEFDLLATAGEIGRAVVVPTARAVIETAVVLDAPRAFALAAIDRESSVLTGGVAGLSVALGWSSEWESDTATDRETVTAIERTLDWRCQNSTLLMAVAY